jgi:hypothetical protein
MQLVDTVAVGVEQQLDATGQIFRACTLLARSKASS